MIRNYDKRNIWLSQVLTAPIESVIPLAGDASARQYYRVLSAGHTYILMDDTVTASQMHFLNIQKKLASHVSVPEIIAYDAAQGLMLLSDLGDDLYLKFLAEDTVDVLYQQAFESLLKLHAFPLQEHHDIPLFNRDFIHKQFEIFIQWYLVKHLNYHVTEEVMRYLTKTFEWLVTQIQAQPQVFTHMDFHSRNLMILKEGGPGILDFQDAMIGPITYDLSSLLKDAYIQWPAERIQRWIQGFQSMAIEQGTLKSEHAPYFNDWFNLTGIQRHIKNLGVFARLCHRDKKSGYLKHIPLLLAYIQEVCEQYTELQWLSSFLIQCNMLLPSTCSETL